MTHTHYAFVQFVEANPHADSVSKPVVSFLRLIEEQQIDVSDLPDVA